MPTLANTEAGRYFLASVAHQTYWAGCFNDRTILFDVNPNEATHLGTINLSGTIKEIKSFVIASADRFVKEQGDKVEHYYPDLKNPPKITPPNDTDLQNASDSLKKANPEFSVPVKSGNNRPFTFLKRERNDLIRGLRVNTSLGRCGT